MSSRRTRQAADSAATKLLCMLEVYICIWIYIVDVAYIIIFQKCMHFQELCFQIQTHFAAKLNCFIVDIKDSLAQSKPKHKYPATHTTPKYYWMCIIY